MSHDRNSDLDKMLHDICEILAAFELYRPDANLFHDSSCVPNRIVGAGLERHEGHIDHDECVLHDPFHGLRMIDHIVDSYRESRFVTLDDIAERIANKDDV